jgi:hypothetical protein
MTVTVYRGKKGDQEYLAIDSVIGARPCDEARVYEVHGENLERIQTFIHKSDWPGEDSISHLKRWMRENLDTFKQLSDKEALSLEDRYPKKGCLTSQLFERLGEVPAIKNQFSKELGWQKEKEQRQR